MLNANNIGLVRYKTVKVATLDSINQMFFFYSPGVQNVSVSVCRWRCCTLLIMFTNKKKSVVCLVVVQPM